MYLEQFGDVHIFRPRLSVELEIRAASERHLRSRFAAKRYEDKGEINSILQHQFTFHLSILERLLPSIASKDFLSFVLYQFDLYGEIDRLQREDLLSAVEDARWTAIGLNLRRAAKYIAERIVLLRPGGAPEADRERLLSLSEKVWICAEQVVDLYMKSDVAFVTFPGHTTLEILPVGEELYLRQEIVKDCPDIRRRMRLDTENRHRFVPDAAIISDVGVHDAVIGSAVRDVLGVSYREAMVILARVIKGAKPAPEGFPVPFINKARAIDQLAKLLNIPIEAVRRVMSGFSISKEQTEAEGWEVWKPNREYRAYRRAFFELPHSTGQHWIFSKAMAEECFTILDREVVFGQLPVEWRGGVVDQSLGRLSNVAGAWFEKVVEDNFRSVNIRGVRAAKKGVGAGGKRVLIPSDVGEIDFIGYSESERILVVAECKLVRYSFEPKYFRDDIYAFVDSKKAYIKKFRRKFQWVRENSTSVCEALASVLPSGATIAPEHITGAIITLFPTMASCFIEDYPCVSLTEFMVDYESENKWPYELGVYPI